MINNTILTGRLTTDAELKTTKNGIPVTQFKIAVNRPKIKDKEQTVDFIVIVAWRKTAELVCTYFKKGSLIGIEGAIQTRNYTDKNGNNRTAFEVVAEKVHFFERKKSTNEPLLEKEFDNNTKATNEIDNSLGIDDIIDIDDDLPF